MTTLEDRYYQPREDADTEEVCRYETPDGSECGADTADPSEVLCPAHAALIDTGVITWKEYRALVDHHAA